jgi:hypothetical protein
MIELEIDTGARPRRVQLSAFLDADAEERAQEQSYRWIKSLRHLRVDDVPFRRRWTVRGDSLWWFAELYLHKTRAMLSLHRTILAFHAMVDRERPLVVRCRDRRSGWLLHQLAGSRQIRYEGPSSAGRPRRQLFPLSFRASALHLAALGSRLRLRRAPDRSARVAAFVHKAFWREKGTDGSAESYIGPVLRELERGAGAESVAYVSVGPSTNFRARRWWSPLGGAGPAAATPVEAFARLGALSASRAIWRTRHDARRALWASAEIRAHATIERCDCWPVVRQELAGIALLQFPWSARVMDEAAAALDALRPRVAVTYAEAGGWGRALALECRRRGIPCVGLQHGFIYRHWLNYRHEPDEMLPDPANLSDQGFPRPAVTLLYDTYAERHLATHGRFPADSLLVTGSARLEALVAGVRAADAHAIEAVRQRAGALAGDRILLVATKQREAARALPAFLAAARDMPHVRVLIKPHPAEPPDVYSDALVGYDHVRVLGPAADLAPLLAASDAVVTVNSTVAIDALSVGVPSLVIGLPNNLSPFVECGAMAGGGSSTDEMRTALTSLLYDEEFRRRLLSNAGRGAGPELESGGAASRSAAAILTLAGGAAD